MTMNTNTKHGSRVVQMTEAERAAKMDEEVDACVAEVLGLAAPPATGFMGKVAAMGRRVKSAVTTSAKRVQGVLTRENAMAAVESSASFGKLAARYTVEASKAAVMRRVQRAIDEKVSGLVGGGGTAKGTR